MTLMTENKQHVNPKKVNTVKMGGKILLILVVIAAAFACGSSGELELSGLLERRTLEVSAPISEIIVELPVKVGDHIKKDTIIVKLDTEVVAAELRAHEAALSAAQAFLKEATGEFTRQDRLRKANISTTQAFDTAKRKKDEAFSLVAEKQARIAQAKKRLADLTIRARVSGVLDQLPYEIGERVPAGGVVAVVIADDNPWVRVWLPARAVTRVNIGQAAKAKIEGLDTWFDAAVEHVSREPEFTPHYALTERESAHLVYETKVRLTNAKKDLPPGIPARVVIPLKED
jgi:HlyD family secretion protein